jgi:hypothetical protein
MVAALTADLDAHVENAVSRTLADTGWFIPLSVRHRIAQAVVAVVRQQDEPDPAPVDGGDLAVPLCCCKTGQMCANCGTGRHWDCPDRDDEGHEACDDEEDDDL